MVCFLEASETIAVCWGFQILWSYGLYSVAENMHKLLVGYDVIVLYYWLLAAVCAYDTTNLPSVQCPMIFFVLIFFLQSMFIGHLLAVSVLFIYVVSFINMNRCTKGKSVQIRFYAHDDQIEAFCADIFKRSK